MLCRGCQYALFNLTGGRCPECGRRYDVREYEFPPGSVAYRCPQCGHDLDESAVFGVYSWTCPHCGKSVNTRACRVVPLQPGVMGQVRESFPFGPGVEPSPLLFYFKNISELAVSPGSFFARISGRETTGAAWLTALMHLLAGLILMGIVNYRLVSAGIFNSIGRGHLVFLPKLAWSILAVWAALVMSFGLAGGVHGVLLAFGFGANRFATTVNIVCYASLPLVFCFVPVIGWVVGPCWFLGLLFVGCRRAHQASDSAAVVAGLILPMVLLSAIGLIIGIV